MPSKGIEQVAVRRTVAEAARALVRELGIRVGEVTVRVSDRGIILIHHGKTLPLEERPLEEQLTLEPQAS